MRIIYFGTPQFSADILQYLLDKKAPITGIVTRPDKPKGRSKDPSPSPVKLLAQKYGISVYQPDKSSNQEFLPVLQSQDADLFVVAAYAEILKESVLNVPRLGSINVHPSLLPEYRGAAPIHRAIMSGDVETGVTIMKMAKELDAGGILATTKVFIGPDTTTGELTIELAHKGAILLWEVIQKITEGQMLAIPQDDAKATYAKKITTEDAAIAWDRPIDDVYNQIRGVTPKPGAWCWIFIRNEKKRLIVRKARKETLIKGEPKQIVSSNPTELIVACQHGSIRLLSVQLEGKKEMNAASFLRGIPIENITFV